MSTAKQIFFTIQGSSATEMLEMPPDCCVKDFADKVKEQWKMEDRGDFKVYLEGKDKPCDCKTLISKIPDDAPVHLGLCERVDVRIYYNGEEHNVCVSPSYKIAILTDDAIKHFKPEDFRDRKYILIDASTEERPEQSLPIGVLVKDNTCSVELNLVPEESWQGMSAISGEQAVECDIEKACFLLGAQQKRWRLIESSWPDFFFEIRAKCGKWWRIKVNLKGYPKTAPEGIFWHDSENRPLSIEELPHDNPPDASNPIHVSFKSKGTEFYCPFDRSGLSKHPEWATKHPQHAWSETKTITFYLERIHDLLNSRDYCPHKNPTS